MPKKRRTREEERLRWAAALLRIAVALWVIAILLCLASTNCLAAETMAADEPDTTRLAATGGVTAAYYATKLLLKLDEPGKRGRRER